MGFQRVVVYSEIGPGLKLSFDSTRVINVDFREEEKSRILKLAFFRISGSRALVRSPSFVY